MAYDPGDTLIRAVMTANSGLPEDVIINDFAFKNLAGSPTNLELSAMMARVSDFYRRPSDPSLPSKVGSYIGSQVDRSATHELQAFKIQAGPLGSPIYTEAWLGPVGSINPDNLPTECAAVLSFHADLTGIVEDAGTTHPRARRRGRVYIGPLNFDAGDFSAPSPFLRGAFTAALRESAVILKDDSATDGAPWCVWSRADQAVRAVHAGWTDNAFDTQRRRGTVATIRSVWGP